MSKPIPREILTPAEVLDFIDPIDPENLQHLGEGVYQALWCPPLPMVDIEMIQNTVGIFVIREPFEPEHLPGWRCVQFAVNTKQETTVGRHVLTLVCDRCKFITDVFDGGRLGDIWQEIEEAGWQLDQTRWTAVCPDCLLEN